MAAWDDSFYRVSDDFGIPVVTKAHIRQGLEIARQLADELGDYFEVEVDADADGETRQRFRSRSDPTNRAAAQAFHDRADRFKTQHEEIQRQIAAGATFKWVAAPLNDR